MVLGQAGNSNERFIIKTGPKTERSRGNTKQEHLITAEKTTANKPSSH